MFSFPNDGHCCELCDDDSTQPHVVRFKNPKEGKIQWNDLVRGEVSFENQGRAKILNNNPFPSMTGFASSISSP